jgi:hypothetical protein
VPVRGAHACAYVQARDLAAGEALLVEHVFAGEDSKSYIEIALRYDKSLRDGLSPDDFVLFGERQIKGERPPVIWRPPRLPLLACSYASALHARLRASSYNAHRAPVPLLPRPRRAFVASATHHNPACMSAPLPHTHPIATHTQINPVLTADPRPRCARVLYCTIGKGAMSTCLPPCTDRRSWPTLRARTVPQARAP